MIDASGDFVRLDWTDGVWGSVYSVILVKTIVFLLYFEWLRRTDVMI